MRSIERHGNYGKIRSYIRPILPAALPAILVLLVLSSSIRCEDAPRDTRDNAALDIPDTAPLLERVLALNRVQEPELDLTAARKAFDDLAKRAEDSVEKAAGPKEKIAALNKILLGDTKDS